MDYLFSDYNYKKKYVCMKNETCKYLTKLMYLLVHHRELSKKHRIDVYNYTQKYLINNVKEINYMNSKNISLLMIACHGGYKEIVEILLTYGAEINHTSKKNKTALMYACQSCNVDVVELLVKKNADVDIINDNGDNCLIIVCKNSNENKEQKYKIAKLLIDKTININNYNHQFYNGLMYSCYNENYKITKLLLENGADANYNNGHRTALMIAVKKCSGPKIVKLLLKYVTDVNEINEKGDNALIYGCRNSNKHKNYKSVELLLRHKAININHKNKHGDTALIDAAKYAGTKSNCQVLQLLLNHGADVTNLNNRLFSALKYAIILSNKSSCLQAVQLLLKFYPNVNIEFENNPGIFINACVNYPETCTRDVLDVLLVSGVNINLTDLEGRTALSYCCEMLNFEATDYLIKNGADINLSDNEGDNPLIDTCTIIPDVCLKNHTATIFRIVDFLLDNGANINASNKNGYNSLMYICKFSNQLDISNILLLLFRNRINVNSTTNSGKTALMLACRYCNNLQTIRILIQHNADVNLKDTKGMSALMICVTSSHSLIQTDIIKILLENGANINDSDMNGNSFFKCLCLLYEYRPHILEIIKLVLSNPLLNIPDIISNLRIFNNEEMFNCINILSDVKKHKSLLIKIHSSLSKYIGVYLYKPGSLRHKILDVKWHINNNVTDFKLIDVSIAKYFCVNDLSSLIFKINDQMNHI